MPLVIHKTIFKFLFSTLVVAGFLLAPSSEIYAASLNLIPSTTTVSVGNILSLKVLLNTSGKYVNNSEATVEFPVEMLEVVSVTKTSSIFTLWVEEPSYSNVSGKIVFNGGVPTPGFNGPSGYIATITFKAKKQGIASVILTDAAVRENDGLGTDILSSKSGSVITIGIPKAVEVPTPAPKTTVEKSLVPSKPVIVSNTHPDQDIWYSNNTATFSWKIPSDVNKIQTLYSKDSDANPTINYDNTVTEKTLNNLNDGTSYFHLKYYNGAGGSLTAHYRVKIDTVSPVAFNPSIKAEDNKNFIKLNAVDVTSGIDYYTLQIDNGEIIKVKLDELVNDEYKLPIQNEGNHDVIVIAYDKAKNNTIANVSFVSSAIIAPVLKVDPKEIIVGGTTTISGETNYPNEKVEVTLHYKDKEIKKYIQTTSKDGTFTIVTDEVKVKGIVSIYAEVILSENVKSSPSATVYLKVVDTKVVSITISILYPLLWIIIILLLIIILFLILYSGWHKFFGLKRKIKREVKDMAVSIHEALSLLKEELNEQLGILEKTKIDRELNKKEKIIFDKIKKNVDQIDDVLEKKLNKIL